MTDKLLGRKSNVTSDFLRPFKGSLDPNDPIFDSESEGDAYLEAYQPSRFEPNAQDTQWSQSTYARPRDNAAIAAAQQDPLSFSEFVITVTTKLLPDAFASGDSGATCEALKALHSSVYHDDFVVRAIRASLDLPMSKQQWMSEFLAILYDSKLLTPIQVNKAFEKLVQQLDDIRLDVPGAHQRVFTFIRCAVDDDVILPIFTLRLPECFLQQLLDTPDDEKNLDLAEIRSHLLTLREYKANFEKFVISQFLTSGSLDDLPLLLVELGHPEFKHEVVRRLIKAAMGLTNVERECVSNTFSDCFGSSSSCFSADDLLVGFVHVLGEIDDIKIDVPEAPTLLAKFVVRAVADEILPPIFVLDAIRLGFGGEEGRNVMRTVKKWVIAESKGKAQFSRFRKVWIATDPDKEETHRFKQQVCDILLQHFADEDFSATRVAIDDLEMTPDQGPELVRKTLELALERSDREQRVAIAFLQWLVQSGDIEAQAIQLGFDAIHARLPELLLDTPKASEVLDTLNTQSQICGLLPNATARS